ncbi:hypothetical protein DPMN_049110 [Dreissena polymorpha]|uniref:PPPDE domain-containing protein n=1 Tax=Dreissena polymorpha TaxID=45954 RepID=A0A9D4DCV4_DREPO|nr:hypothetical protein DPMN_049110 [Dreissena polymorpha]
MGSRSSTVPSFYKISAYSTGSSTDTSNASFGKNWKNEIFLEISTGKGLKYDDIRDNEELLTKFKDFVGVHEKINKVRMYRTRLFVFYAFCEYWLHHLFVVFETDKYGWSIEKHSDVITIQLNDDKCHVQRYLVQKRRLCQTLVAEGEGRMSVYDLIKWLKGEDELNNTYHVMSSNCKLFANRVFEHLIQKQRSSKL